jgi:iron(III) transport system permease protein
VTAPTVDAGEAPPGLAGGTPERDTGRGWSRRLTQWFPWITGRRVLAVGAFATLLILVVPPLATTLFAAFRGPADRLPLDDGTHASLDNFRAILQSGGLGRTARDTAIFVLGSMLVAMTFGVAIAWLIERTNLRFRRGFYLLVFAPYLIPPIINAQAWQLLLLRENGLLNRLLRLVLPFNSGPLDAFSMPGMVLAQGLSWVALVVLLMGAAFRNMDSTFEEASRMSGVSVVGTFRRITARLLIPSLLGTALLLSVFLIGQFEIPLVFGLGAGLEPFGLRIYKLLITESSVPPYGQVAAYSALMVAIAYGLILLYRKLVSRADRYTTVTGKGYRANRLNLGRWQVPAIALMVVYILVAVVLPITVLLWQSVVPIFQPDVGLLRKFASLHAYRELFGDPRFRQAAKNTVVISLGAALVTTVLGSTMAWVVARYRGRRVGRAALDTLASTSLGIPSPVAAFSLYIFFLTTVRVLPIYGTLWALVLGYSFRVGVAYRVALAGFLQISRELEEASAMSGAGVVTTLRRVLLPLMLPTVGVVFILGLITAMNEFSIPIFLGNPETHPLSVYAFGRMQQWPDQAAAIGVMSMGVVLLLAGVCRRVALKRAL